MSRVAAAAMSVSKVVGLYNNLDNVEFECTR